MEMNKNSNHSSGRIAFSVVVCSTSLNFGWTGGNRSRDIKERVQLVKPTVRIPQLVSTASRKEKK